jgi:hypothetical protein
MTDVCKYEPRWPIKVVLLNNQGIRYAHAVWDSGFGIGFTKAALYAVFA